LKYINMMLKQERTVCWYPDC